MDVHESGSKQYDGTIKDFQKLLLSTAELGAQRRGSNCIDNSDIKSAYQDLINSRRRPRVLDIMAEIGLVAAGVLAGVSITVIQQDLHNIHGYAIAASAGFICLMSAVVKHAS